MTRFLITSIFVICTGAAAISLASGAADLMGDRTAQIDAALATR